MSGTYELNDDHLLQEYLSAQTPPPNWCLYKVVRYLKHDFLENMIGEGGCRYCALQESAHRPHGPGTYTALVLLKNGPVRKLSVLTTERDELDPAVRSWLSTMLHLGDIISAQIDGWIAYDGRGGT